MSKIQHNTNNNTKTTQLMLSCYIGTILSSGDKILGRITNIHDILHDSLFVCLQT